MFGLVQVWISAHPFSEVLREPPFDGPVGPAPPQENAPRTLVEGRGTCYSAAMLQMVGGFTYLWVNLFSRTFFPLSFLPADLGLGEGWVKDKLKRS